MSEPTSSNSLSYRDAGVDIAAAEAALDASKDAIHRSHGERVLADVGSFGGLFRADGLAEKPVLVASNDGVGTKIRIASAIQRFDTVGRCLVQHCINDILVQGAEPLFFLDYVGVGKLDPEMVASAITGVANACADHGVALLGGETAEMPGVYPEGEFDLVGTVVGVVERDDLIDGSAVNPGDKLIGLPSVGLHTNGYSLARRIVEERMGITYTDTFPGDTRSAADVLLDPHLCYLETLRPFLKNKGLHAMAHITGGGVPGNLPRVLNGLGAKVSRNAVPEQNVFQQLCAAGNVERDESWKAFNMGVGMILVVDPGSEEEFLTALSAQGQTAFAMGEISADVEGVAWLD
ncbi:MAG: phosphoribosylformylglycinamidine cyclo-ligase [Planctomycetota bacterium]|nr:MAG: phosphoribosylformylglycinamidine cyclo-ligase [Planctomycetota bacterium]